MHKISPAIKGLLTLAILGCSSVAIGQNYPSHSVRLVVGFAAGGQVDITGRLIAARLSDTTGQPFVVENRQGAGGVIGADFVAKSAPDGYTLLIASGSHTVSPALFAKMPYDTAKDFAPISTITLGPQMLVIDSTLPATNVKEFVAYAKAHPGKVNFGSGGVGSLQHLEGELLNSVAGIELVHIPYKGANDAMTDAAAGRVQLVFASPSSAQPFLKSGKLRAIGLSGSKRLKEYPNIPTVAESGLPQFVSDAITGMIGPAALPKQIVGTMNAVLVKIVNSPDFQAQMQKSGVEASSSTPEEYQAAIEKEIAHWKQVVKDAAIPMQ